MTPVEIAKKYLGMDELSGNRFDDKTPLGRAIRAAGHRDGEPWCCYFQEAVFCEAYPSKEQQIRKLFSANCFETYCNFLHAGHTVLQNPVVGAMVLFQSVKDGAQSTKGHAGLVTEVLSKTQFKSIEGNTSEAGSREGTTVGEQSRDILPRHTGLNVLGFVII